MKAEHRKELQTNYLADRMGRLIQNVKSGPRSSSTVVWVFLGLTLVTFGVWYYLQGATRSSQADAWLKLSGATRDLDALGTVLPSIQQELPGTTVELVTRFQDARLMLNSGLTNYATDERDKALTNLAEARRLYQQLASRAAAYPILAQEALLGMASAEEALAGAGKPGSTESQGSFDKAAEYYQQVICFGLKQAGHACKPENALAVLRQKVCEQVKKLTQKDDCQEETALAAYQKLENTSPELFREPLAEATQFKGQTYFARQAAQRYVALRDHRDQVEKFYTQLDQYVAALKPKEEPKKDETKVPEAPKPGDGPKVDVPKAPDPVKGTDGLPKAPEPPKSDLPKAPEAPKDEAEKIAAPKQEAPKEDAGKKEEPAKK